jgi:hypothetical protein
MTSPLYTTDAKDLVALERLAMATGTPDQFAEGYMRIAAAKEFLANTLKLLDDRVAEFVKEHGPFVVNDVEYRMGKDKKIKPRDPKAMLEKMFDIFSRPEAIEKNIEAMAAVASCLSDGADTWKQGTVLARMKELGHKEWWDLLFVVIEDDKLEKKLLKTNLNFLPPAKAGTTTKEK